MEISPAEIVDRLTITKLKIERIGEPHLQKEYEAYIKKLKELVDNDKAEELIDELSSNDERRVDLVEIKNQIFKLKEDVQIAKEKRN